MPALSQTLTNIQQTPAAVLHYLLAWCLKNNWQSISAILITLGADVNRTFPNGETLLHGAVREGNLQTIDFLIAAKANVNALDKCKHTPLELAIRRLMTPSNNQQDALVLCNRLIEANADAKMNIFELLKPEISIFFYAIKHNLKDIVSKMLRKDPGLARHVDINGITPLRFAIQATVLMGLNDYEIVTLIKEHTTEEYPSDFVIPIDPEDAALIKSLNDTLQKDRNEDAENEPEHDILADAGDTPFSHSYKATLQRSKSTVATGLSKQAKKIATLRKTHSMDN